MREEQAPPLRRDGDKERRAMAPPVGELSAERLTEGGGFTTLGKAVSGR